MTHDIAQQYAEKRLGKNYADALRVAGVLRAGEKTPALSDNFGAFGGYKQVREALESVATAKQFRDAETTARTVSKDWRAAIRESKGQDSFANALSSGSSQDAMASLTTALSGGDTKAASSLQSVFGEFSRLMKEKDKAPNDTARERINSEAEAKLKEANEKMMADLAEQAADHDALNLAAVIVVLGREITEAAVVGLYDAVVGS